MLTTIDNIQSLIPQKPPFVMIDELLSSDDTTTVSRLKVRADNIFTVDGRLTEPGLVENIAQTAAARSGYEARSGNKPVLVGYIGSIKNLQIADLPLLDETIETEITIANQIFDITVIQGKATCNGRLIATCEMKIFINQLLKQ